MTQRVTRDLQALERRRKQAARLFAKGNLPQASVARELKVSRMSVSRWHRQWKKSGKEALREFGLMASALTYGPYRAWQLSSNVSPAYGIIRATSGRYWAP